MQIRISAEANVDTRLQAAMIAHAKESYILSGRAEGRADRSERAGMILAERPQVREAKAKVEAAEAKFSRACEAVDRHRERCPTGLAAKITGREAKWEAALAGLEAKAEKASEAVDKAKEVKKAVEDRCRPGAESEARRNAKENAADRKFAADKRRLGDALSSGDPAFAATIKGLIAESGRPVEIALKCIRPDKLTAAARDWEPPAAKANPETLKALATLDFEAPKGYGR